MQLAQALFGQLLLAVLFDVPGINSYCSQLRLPPVVRSHQAAAPLHVHPLQEGLHRGRLVVQQGLGVTWLQLQVKSGAVNGVDWALRRQNKVSESLNLVTLVRIFMNKWQAGFILNSFNNNPIRY